MTFLPIKKRWKVLSFLVSSFLFIQPCHATFTVRGKPRSLCATGVESFRTNVHPILRGECRRCHDVGGKGPAHSVENVEASYSFVISYVNWGNLAQSKLVKEVGAAHWNKHSEVPGPNPKVTEEQVLTAIENWWQGGQKECPSFGNFVSKPKVLDEDLTGWKRVNVPLPNETDFLKNGFFSIEMKANDKQYWVRKPILEGITASAKIKTVYLLLNGRVIETPFDLIRAIVRPEDRGGTSVLSPYTTLIPVEKQGTDALSIGFDVLGPVAPRECVDLERFNKHVIPVLQLRSCYECHQGVENPVAKLRLNMEGDERQQCRALLDRGNGKYTVESPLFVYPLRGVLGHPGSIPHQSEVLPSWLEWLKSEKAHEF